MDNLVTCSDMSALPGKKEVVVGSKVSHTEYEVLQRICEEQDRSMSYVLRELAMRGLAQFFRDGHVKPDAADTSAIERAIKPLRSIAVAPHSKRRLPLINPDKLEERKPDGKKKSKRVA